MKEAMLLVMPSAIPLKMSSNNMTRFSLNYTFSLFRTWVFAPPERVHLTLQAQLENVTHISGMTAAPLSDGRRIGEVPPKVALNKTSGWSSSI